MPHDYPFGEFQNLYQLAWQQGLKGCTTFRIGTERGQVLSVRSDPDQAADACCIAA